MRYGRKQPMKNSRRRCLARVGWAGFVVAIALLLAPEHLAAQGGIQVENTIWVPATLDSVDNCQRLRETLDGLPASPDHVVYLAPGFYYCLSSILYVPDRVTLIGDGSRTFILGDIDNVLTGVVHLTGNAELRGVTVVNLVSNPTNAAIAVSAWVLGTPGRPKLFDVNATVNVSSGSGYPLWVGQAVNIKVTGGNFRGGNILLTASTQSALLVDLGLEGVDADPMVNVKCYFFLNLLTGVPSAGYPSVACP